MKEVEYHVARDFSETPGGRFKAHGPWSGEEFRAKALAFHLGGAVAGQHKMVVVLDGAAGYSSGFLEEAFGGLVRHGPFGREEIEKHLAVVARDKAWQGYADQARDCMEAAWKRMESA